MTTELTCQQIRVRPSESKDAERISILCEQLGYSATPQQIQERLARIQQNDTDVVYVATLANHYVVGWAHAHACDLLISPKQALLFGLVVDESYRHSGIGRLLMQHVEKWASLHDCQGIIIRSNIKRKEAHRFYEKIGYINIKQSLAFYKELIEES